MKSKLLTGLLGFFIAILIITFSIGLPIYVRPFYYLQIDLLDIPEDSGASREDIITAFNEVMDYLTLPGEEFSTGIFRHSESGKSHFVDCKRLFDLNICAFFISLIGAATLLMLNKRKVFELWRPFGMNVSFFSGAYTLGVFALIGGLAALDFDKAFEIFHHIFFPGKDNWQFNWYYDEIIRILPQDFFMNCAILILTSVILLGIGCVVGGLVERRMRRKKES